MDDVAATASADASTLSAASNAAPLSLPASLDLGSFGFEGQFDPSADALNFEYDHLASDASPSPLLPEFLDFDYNDFLSDDVVSGAAPSATAGINGVSSVSLDSAEPAFSLFNDLETQVSSENPFQQPQSGASSFGCDDGGLAVGV